MPNAQVLTGQKAIMSVTRTKAPTIEITGEPLAFNRDIDMAGLSVHLEPWARRWAPVLRNDNAVVVNSVLDKREWADLDREVFEMVKLRLNGVNDLSSRGLTKSSNLAVMLSQWRVASERARPSVSMDGRTRADRDRTDRKVYGVPIPIFRTDYEIGARELLASRTLGDPLDTFEAGEAAAAVAEEQERMLFNGDTSIVVQGDSISGYTTLAARDTATAAAYGGGDFATISNILPTYLGALAALAAKRYHGPFISYIAQTQYHEMLDTYTDGSGKTGLDRVEMLPQIDEVKPSDMLTTGNMVLVQMTKNVVDWHSALETQNREWSSGDEQATFFAVMAAAAPRLKTDAGGNAGIAHATSC